MSPPLVSAVIPAFNAERFIATALDAVLAQTYKELEVIVVDDGSTDETAAIAGRYPVRLLRGENQGAAAALNRGIDAAGAELIAFCDADDIWMPDRISAQVDYLLAHPEAGVVTCDMEVFLEPRTVLPQWMDEADFATRRAMIPSALLVRQEVFDRLGGFDPSFTIGFDTDWMVRAVDAGIEIGSVDRTLIRYRVHDANNTRDIRTARDDVFRALRASIDRKRRTTERQA
jgi:glycosyltransferase involved in cell wall biosynthesis